MIKIDFFFFYIAWDETYADYNLLKCALPSTGYSTGEKKRRTHNFYIGSKLPKWNHPEFKSIEELYFPAQMVWIWMRFMTLDRTPVPWGSFQKTLGKHDNHSLKAISFSPNLAILMLFFIESSYHVGFQLLFITQLELTRSTCHSDSMVITFNLYAGFKHLTSERLMRGVLHPCAGS